MLRILDISDPCKFCKQKLNVYIKKLTLYRTLSVRYKSHYHTLGLDSDATAKDIKTAYYELSLKYHPDKNDGSEESANKFKEITEAYEILSNPNTKKNYDENANVYPQYSNKYKDSAKFYRSSQYRGPYTGKSKDFNYDEHYKRHYEDLQKQKEMEYEYFRRRWEAEFYRRYPTAEAYYRNRHKEKSETFSTADFKRRISLAKYSFYIMFWAWCFMVAVGIFDFYFNPEKNIPPKRIYYKVEKDVESEPNK